MFENVLKMVERDAKIALERKAEQIRQEFVTQIRNWRIAVKHLLAKPAIYTEGNKYPIKNTSPFPRFRTGNLVRSIPTYGVRKWKPRVIGKGKIQVAVRIRRRDKANTAWDTYGEALNRWNKPDTKLTGWKDRAYAILSHNINKRIKGIL